MDLAHLVSVFAVFAQVGLTFWAIVRMGQVRISALRRKEVRFSDIALSGEKYPDKVKQYQNNTRNQFETPILLYGVVALQIALGSQNWGIPVGAVLFVFSRIVHRHIHVGSNNLRHRFNAYTFGLACLALAWISLMVETVNRAIG